MMGISPTAQCVFCQYSLTEIVDCEGDCNDCFIKREYDRGKYGQKHLEKMQKEIRELLEPLRPENC